MKRITSIFLLLAVIFCVCSLSSCSNPIFVEKDEPTLCLYSGGGEIKVKVTPNNKKDISWSYPELKDKLSWEMYVNSEGKITDLKRYVDYDSLDWTAAKGNYKINDSVGFCIKGTDTEAFLKEKLEYMGLSEGEINDFVFYWSSRMSHNPYNYIYFANSEYSELKPTIEPEPDTYITVFMVWKALEKPINVSEQKLEKSPARNGFTAVLYGGCEIYN